MTEFTANTSSAPPLEPETTVQKEPNLTTRPYDATASHPTLTPDDVQAVEHLVTEDDTPVDNLFSERQQRLLTHSLYASWQGPGSGRTFLAAADVGVFRAPAEAPLVPDVFLSLDVKPPNDWWAKPNRVYSIWQYGKPPDIVIEIVSNTEGGEAKQKLIQYARFGVPHYVIFDPLKQVLDVLLRAHSLNSSGEYEECPPDFLPIAGLGLRLWRGVFEGREDSWLRWHDESGVLILTGEERATLAENRAEQAENRTEQAENRAEQAENRAEQERSRAELERNRAERLAAQLRAYGISPENGQTLS